jgi:Cys-rich repeat protein
VSPNHRTRLDTERPISSSRIKRSGIKPGTPAPTFRLPDLDANDIALEHYRGRPVVLVFSDPGCGPCNAMAPALAALARTDRNLRIVMVSRGDRAANREKAREAGFTFPIVLQDGWQLSKRYGIFATPVAFLIDESGVVARSVAVGGDAILALVASAISAQPISRPASLRGAAATLSRFTALGRIAGGVVTALFMRPLAAGAVTCTTSAQCPSGQVCQGGTCVAATCTSSAQCPSGQVCQGGTCVAATCTSSAQCPSGQVCQGGTCVAAPCGAGLTNCTGQGCVNFQTDPHNCGGCGVACPSGMTCQNGACVSATACPTGQTRCGGVCVDTKSDVQNCGGCGLVCPPGFKCINGICTMTSPCAKGLTLCGKTCVDLTSDPRNCGACGKRCPTGMTCHNGTCVKKCDEGLVLCGDRCVDFAKDPNNCGACGKRCPAGMVCVKGECVKPCPPGSQRCGNTCVKTASDPKNCGGCGIVCESGACVGGRCRPDRVSLLRRRLARIRAA